MGTDSTGRNNHSDDSGKTIRPQCFMHRGEDEKSYSSYIDKYRNDAGKVMIRSGARKWGGNERGVITSQ